MPNNNNHPMTIGIDVRCLMHKNYSGVAEYTYNLLTHLFKADPQNSYKLFYNSKTNVSATLPKFDQPNVKYQGFEYPNKLLNLSFKFLNYPKIDQIIKGADVFFLPNLIFSALSANCQKIITIHDLSFELFPNFFSYKRNLWHKIINPKKIINNCDKVIAVSQNTKIDLINLYDIPADKIEVVHSGVDHQLYNKINEQTKFKLIKEKYKLPNDFILYLGTIEPRKNIEGIIQAFNLFKEQNSKFKHLKLIIAGDKGWKYEKVFDLAQKSPYKQDIKFIGYVSRQDKPLLYNLSKIFLFPSFYEGFGLPVLEAQACGTPVIAGLNSAFPEILKNSALLINPDNLNEISQAIKELLTGKNLYQELMTKGLDNVKNFTWDKTAQKTLKILKA